MQVQLNIRINGRWEVKGSEVASTLRSLATDFEQEPKISEGDDFGLRDANGDEVVWCVVEPDAEVS